MQLLAVAPDLGGGRSSVAAWKNLFFHSLPGDRAALTSAREGQLVDLIWVKFFVRYLSVKKKNKRKTNKIFGLSKSKPS